MPPPSFETRWKAICVPSGDHVGARWSAGSFVRRKRLSLPRVLTYKSKAVKSCSPVHSKATRAPSGEIAGKSAHPGRAVSGTATTGGDSGRWRHFRYASVPTAMQTAPTESQAASFGHGEKAATVGGEGRT